MIRISGSAKQAEYLEAKIKKNTEYLKVPFFAFKHDGGQNGNELGKEEKSRCFTRDYEIIGAKDKIMQVKNSEQKWIRDIMIWFTCKPIQITFRYDLRVDKCEVSVSWESWQRIIKLIPSLVDDIKTTETNRCEIIAVPQS
jgi:hypothetical protein